MKNLIQNTLLLLFCATLCFAEPKISMETLVKGMGPAAQQGEEVEITYQLKSTEGETLEQRGIKNPFRFLLGTTNVIGGLNQGIEGMTVGEKRKLIIPPELGYGSKDLGFIPPNSTLIFEVELLQIHPTEPTPTVNLKDRFQDENFLVQRHAEDITKPAMFEYMIRDFFTKPWRYEDGHSKIWRSVLHVSLVLILTCFLALFGRNAGWWIL